MNPLDFPLLADENIDPEVIAELRRRRLDVVTAKDLGLGGAPDRELLKMAYAEGRLIITHDSDFGTLAIRDGEPLIGVVHFRPGHIDPTAVIEMIEAVNAIVVDAEPPFVIVAARRGGDVRIRVRRPK